MNIINQHYEEENGCGCEQKTVQEEVTSSACVPYNTEGCKTWTKSSCVFWDGDDYPQFGIKKGMRMTEVVLILLNKIATLEGMIP